MNIFDIHEWLLYVITKEQTAWSTPAELDNVLNIGQKDIFNQYAPIYGMDEIAKKALDPFRTRYQFDPSLTPGGLLDLPDDYEQLIGLTTTSYDNTQQRTVYWDVPFLNDDELGSALNSQLNPVTVSKPVAQTGQQGQINLYPTIGNTGFATYLRTPAAPKMNFTQPSPRVIVYNLTGSVQLEWYEAFLPKVMARALYYLGINIDDTALVQIMNTQSKEVV